MRRCVNPECRAPLVALSQWRKGVRPANHSPHAARGFCRRCYERDRLHGTAAYLGVTQRSAEEVLDDYALIRDDVRSIKQAAGRLGMSFAALDQALYRARRRGDTRGNAPISQINRAIRSGHTLPIVRTEEAA